MEITLYMAGDKTFSEFIEIFKSEKIYFLEKLKTKLKYNKKFKATNIQHIGHVVCEKLFYRIETDIDQIEFLCGNKDIDVADNLNDGFCLLSNKEITQKHIDFLEKFDFDKELSKEGIENIIKEWKELNHLVTEKEIITGKKLFKVLKKAFNYAFENGYNIIWEYSK